MRIKRFEAKDTQTAMTMVKRELGDDAIILATRSLPPETKGGRARIEVVAAMDYDLDDIEAASAVKPSPAPGYGYQTVRRTSPAEIPIEPPPPAAAAPLKNTAPHLEAHDLRLRFADLMRLGGTQGKQPAVRYRPTDPSLRPAKTQPPPVDPLKVRQWRDDIIDKIQISALEGRLRVNDPQGETRSRRQERGGTEKKAGHEARPTVIALVGATGVGKTTTAAKLAAWHTLRQGLRVALLSMDCYRIGATDQLRTYAQIMRLPCEIVLRQPDLTKALQRHHDKDVIIIDTAGKSPYDQAHILELQAWFAPCPEIMPYLVLSATAKKEDLHAIIDAYAPLSVAGLILTKLDETRAYAAICQQVVASSLPVSFLSTGQRVPEDFLAASKDFMDTLFKDGWDAAEPFLAARSGHYQAS